MGAARLAAGVAIAVCVTAYLLLAWASGYEVLELLAAWASSFTSAALLAASSEAGRRRRIGLAKWLSAAAGVAMGVVALVVVLNMPLSRLGLVSLVSSWSEAAVKLPSISAVVAAGAAAGSVLSLEAARGWA
ncbi:MAG: hypothetical protein DRN96_05945 [Thermoproteota archaeon]|nr:MAG: hypothetical protein DRN96_05945 [Candidatus Korarchaeota archaeon]RLG51425.1 MAG: hypothetical protein DRN99_08565 [Candidatus Korarchaeota archaeon]